LVPALIQCLQDPRPEVRERASFPLQTLGASAAPALPALTNALHDPVPGVRTNAARTIKYINQRLQN
jgi:HEAT repeat protein